MVRNNRIKFFWCCSERPTRDSSGNDRAGRYRGMFQYLVSTLTLLTQLQMYSAIKEWGKSTPLEFSGDHYSDIYLCHMMTLEGIRCGNVEAYHVITHSLYRYCKWVPFSLSNDTSTYFGIQKQRGVELIYYCVCWSSGQCQHFAYRLWWIGVPAHYSLYLRFRDFAYTTFVTQ